MSTQGLRPVPGFSVFMDYVLHERPHWMFVERLEENNRLVGVGGGAARLAAGYLLWRIGQDAGTRALVVSSDPEGSAASIAADQIRAHVGRARFREVFPGTVVGRSGEGWFRVEGAVKQEHTVQAASIAQVPLGSRYDVAIVDLRPTAHGMESEQATRWVMSQIVPRMSAVRSDGRGAEGKIFVLARDTSEHSLVHKLTPQGFWLLVNQRDRHEEVGPS